jgi:PAS domain S-box-containing protein
MDVDQRTLSQEQKAGLRTIANQVMAQLELRHKSRLDNQHRQDCQDDMAIERKKAEEIFRGNEHKFRAIFDQAPVGIATIDSLTGRFKSVNPAYCKIIGYTGEEMVARTFLDITHPDDLQADLDRMKQLLDGEIATFEMDKRLFRKDGGAIWVHLTCVPLWLKPSDQRVHMALVQDISERKLTEERVKQFQNELGRLVRSRTEDLQQTQGLLQCVIDSSPDWIFVKDLTHRFVLVNKAFASSQQLTPEDMIGKLDSEFWPHELCEGNPGKGIRGFHADDRLAFAGELVHNPCDPASLHDGTLRIFDTYKGPWRDQNGLIGGVLCYAHDVTEQRRAEEVARHLNSELTSRVEARTAELAQANRLLHSDIAVRKLIEEALRESEQSIRALHEATAMTGLSFKERIQAVLEVGCQRFGLPIGMLTRALGEKLEFTHVCAPGTDLTAGMALPLGATYCNTTLQQTDPVCFEHAGASDWRNHPGYRALGLESYIGTKLVGRDQIHGTVCFAGQAPLPQPFSQADKDFIQLIARWISEELDRQKTEQALIQSEERFRTLYDDAPTMYFTLSTDGRVLSVNRFGAEQLGYQVEELVGRSVLSVFHEEDRETVAANLSECLATPETTRHWEFRKVRKDGNVIWVQETARVGQSSTGETVLLVTCEDITERRRAEEALQEMNLALANAMPGIARLDPRGHYLAINEMYASALGYDPSELIGGPWSLTVFRDHLSRAEAAYNMMLQEGKAEFEALAVRKNGSTFWKQVLMVKIVDHHGRHIGHHCFMRDITERKQAEQLIRESQQRLQAVVEGTSDAVFMKDLQGRYLLFNSAAGRFVGKKPEEVIGHDDRFLFPHDDAQALMEQDRAVMVGRQVKTYEEHITTADGLRRTFFSTKGPLFDSNGAVIGLFGVARDITERYRAEEALRFSEERFRLVAEATQDVLWDWNLSTGIRWWSQNGKEKFGDSMHSERDGHEWASRLHPDDRDRALSVERDAFSSNERMFSREYRFRLADGSYGHFHDRAYILRDGSGKPIGAMIDVTAAKQAYASLQEAYHRLQLMANKLQTVESNERRRLSRELHDEIGQLLTALKLDLESIRRERRSKKKLLPLQIEERLARSLETTDLLFTRLRHIVRALRPPVLEELGLKAALESLAADMRTRTGLVCSVVVEGEDNRSVIAPTLETAIYRIAQELLTNVVRHARASTASISLTASPSHWILTVGDDGIGFDPKALPLTAGIGLKGIHERVEIFGGQVELTSQRGQGTLAIVWIPLGADQPPQASLTPPPKVGP